MSSGVTLISVSLFSQLSEFFFFCIVSNSFGVLKFSLLISTTCFALGTLVCLF